MNAGGALDKRRIARMFARAARSYEQHDALQREVATRTLEQLDYVRLDPRRVILGRDEVARAAAQLQRRQRRERDVVADREGHGAVPAPRAIVVANSRACA